MSAFEDMMTAQAMGVPGGVQDTPLDNQTTLSTISIDDLQDAEVSSSESEDGSVLIHGPRPVFGVPSTRASRTRQRRGSTAKRSSRCRRSSLASTASEAAVSAQITTEVAVVLDSSGCVWLRAWVSSLDARARGQRLTRWLCGFPGMLPR